MRVGKLLKASGLAALASAMFVTALPAQAAPDERGRPAESRGYQPQSRADRGAGQRAVRIDRGNGNQVRQQRAQRVDDRSERRAQRVENRGDRNAARAAQQGDYRQARQIDRRSEAAAGRIERIGDARAAQIAREGQREDYRNRDRTRATNDDRVGVSYRDRQYRGQGYDYRGRDNDNRDRGYDRRDYNDRGNTARSNWGGNRNDWRGDNRARNYQRWDNRSWRNDRRYDWSGYRSSNRRLFTLGRYYAPYRNYAYRRVGIGFTLDGLFFGSRYWISDPWQYRLPTVYGPYRWVRYYDDVVLVDSYSGEVVDVIYDFFW